MYEFFSFDVDISLPRPSVCAKLHRKVKKHHVEFMKEFLLQKEAHLDMIFHPEESYNMIRNTSYTCHFNIDLTSYNLIIPGLPDYSVFFVEDVNEEFLRCQIYKKTLLHIQNDSDTSRCILDMAVKFLDLFLLKIELMALLTS